MKMKIIGILIIGLLVCLYFIQRENEMKKIMEFENIQNAKPEIIKQALTADMNWTPPDRQSGEERLVKGLEVTGKYNDYLPLVKSKLHYEPIPVDEFLVFSTEKRGVENCDEYCFRLGLIHLVPLLGYPQDIPRARSYFQSAHNHTEALSALEYIKKNYPDLK